MSDAVKDCCGEHYTAPHLPGCTWPRAIGSQQPEAAKAFDWTWLPAAIEKLGEPQISPPTPGTVLNPGALRPRLAHALGVPIEGRYRRAWVWFSPDSSGWLANTGVHVDTRPEGSTTLAAWRHGNADTSFRRCELTQTGPLTDEQVRAALGFAWQELAP